MPINVDFHNLENNPCCAHGPTLKFIKTFNGKTEVFYACSAVRDSEESLTISRLDSKKSDSQNVFLGQCGINIPQFDRDEVYNRLKKFIKLKKAEKLFCNLCNDFVFPDEKCLHSSHPISVINSHSLKNPSSILNPVTKNKGQAQYWFSEKTIKFITGNLVKLKVDKVLSIGSPTVHESLKHLKVNSLLLDIDYRFHWFFYKHEFLWFNMFNFYFMRDDRENKQLLHQFVENSKVAIVIDPPFGARIEAIQYTLEKLQDLCSFELQIMLILPYFMEKNVLQSFPAYEMLDFPVDYSNHKKFKDKNNKKCFSPVRIFTNIPPNEFTFPKNEGYHFCKKCEAWRSKMNIHCDICGLCPSKNGKLYKHCSICNKCFKRTWKHCKLCNFCVVPSHFEYKHRDSSITQ